MRWGKVALFLLTLGFISGATTEARRRNRSMRRLKHELEDRIDETLDDTFPADDATSWSPEVMNRKR